MTAIMTTRGRIGVTEEGAGPALPILFLHGVGSDKSVWAPQLAYFGGTRRAIALDYPGYGESDGADDASRDDFALAAWAALDTLGVERAHLCGLSLGGVVAIAMHALAPSRCASLILADTFAVHPEGEAIYARSTQAAARVGMRALAEARASSLLGSAATPAMRDEVVATMSRIDPVAYALGARAVWLADQRDRINRINVPTLILCGTEDSITPPSLSRDLASAIPGSACHLIDAAGHLANLERPDAFNRMVDQFLSGFDQKA